MIKRLWMCTSIALLLTLTACKDYGPEIAGDWACTSATESGPIALQLGETRGTMIMALDSFPAQARFELNELRVSDDNLSFFSTGLVNNEDAQPLVETVTTRVEWAWLRRGELLELFAAANRAPLWRCRESKEMQTTIAAVQQTFLQFESEQSARTKRVEELSKTRWGKVALGSRPGDICSAWRQPIMDALTSEGGDFQDIQNEFAMSQLEKFNCFDGKLHVEGIPGLGRVSTALPGIAKVIEASFANAGPSQAPVPPLPQRDSSDDALPSPEVAAKRAPVSDAHPLSSTAETLTADRNDFEFALRQHAARSEGGASFDCSMASTSAEVTLCSSDKLRLSDFLLGKFFAEARQASAEAEIKLLKSSQIAWIRERNARCGADADCFVDQNLRRMRELFQTHRTLRSSSDPSIRRLSGLASPQQMYVAPDERLSFDSRFVLHHASDPPHIANPGDPEAIGGPSCAATFRQSSNEEERLLSQRGWLLSESGRRLGNRYVVIAHGDLNGGQCRSLDNRLFIFVDEQLSGFVASSDTRAAAITPKFLLESGEFSFGWVGWSRRDAACCPSEKGTHRILFPE